MGTMPINKLIINMSLPLITSMFIQAFYNIVDSLFVSRINEEALTAVSMSFPAQNLMISAGTGVGVGITALIARYLGAKDEKGVTKVVHNGIFLGILNSILFVIFGLFFNFYVLTRFQITKLVFTKFNTVKRCNFITKRLQKLTDALLKPQIIF